MTMDMLLKLLRQALTFVGGILVGKGYLDDATAQAVIGALMTLISAGWMMARNTKTAQIANVIAMPEVAVVGTTPEIAAAIPDAGVVPASNVSVAR